MIHEPSPEQIAKLPVWAQRRLFVLQQERNSAVKALNDFVDRQTPAPISYQQLLCLGEQQGPSFKTCFIQSTKVSVEWAGVRLDVYLKQNSDGGIELQWQDQRRQLGQIAFVPISFQRASLIAPAFLRS